MIPLTFGSIMILIILFSVKGYRIALYICVERNGIKSNYNLNYYDCVYRDCIIGLLFMVAKLDDRCKVDS